MRTMALTGQTGALHRLASSSPFGAVASLVRKRWCTAAFRRSPREIRWETGALGKRMRPEDTQRLPSFSAAPPAPSGTRSPPDSPWGPQDSAETVHESPKAAPGPPEIT